MDLFKRIKSKKGNKPPTKTSVATASPTSSSAADATGRSGTRTTLQNLNTVLEIGKSVGDASQLLGPMKTVCGVLQTLINLSLMIQANGEDLQDLVDKLEAQREFIKQQLTVLDGPDFCDAKLANQDLVNVFENYYADLEKLQIKLKALSKEYIDGKKKLPKKVLIAKAVEEEISNLTRKLDDSFQRFMNSINSFIAGQTVLIRNELADLRERFALSQLPLADARGNMHDPCLEGTRIDLLEQISRWATDESATSILALIDLAGTGKSTIATHMVRQWEKDKKLAARFFFSKPTTVTGKNFASTVARDVAENNPSLVPLILSALKEHKSIAACSIQDQLEWILFTPLRSTTKAHIMVIDALDECSLNDRGIILDSILGFLSEYPNGGSPLKVLLTSRPETDIMKKLNSPTCVDVVQLLDFSLRPELSQSNQDDICLYVETYLGDKLTREEIEQFIARCEGWFIWASTARQFLYQAKSFKARFKTLLSPNSKKSPLDNLYTEIIEAALAGYEEEEEEALKRVLQAVCVAREPLNVKALDELLDLESGVANTIVSSLSSVLSAGSHDQPVYILHPTFLEHLQNPSKPGPIFILNKKAECLVTSGCLSSLCNGLKYDICGVLRPVASAPMNREFEDLSQRLEERTTPAMRYAAVHALSHVASCLGDAKIIEKLRAFFESKLLNWIELVSLLGKVYSAIQALYRLTCSIGNAPEPSSNTMLLDVQEWCDETLKLIQPYQTVIEMSAMQVYFSALPFLPKTTLISIFYLPSLQQSIPKVLYQKTSSSRSKVLAGHQSRVDSIAISSDDGHVISADKGGNIRHWDVVTGGCVEELKFNNLFNSDSFMIIRPFTDGIFAAVVYGRSITLQNVRTMAILWEVQCADTSYSLAETGVIFSPNGRLLASHHGPVIQIWDVETGQESWQKDIGGEICHLALSPDGKLLVHADDNWVVCVWDIASGNSVVLPTSLNTDPLILSPIPSLLSSSSSVFTTPNTSFIFSFSSDGKILAGLLPGAGIRLWYLEDREAVHHRDIQTTQHSDLVSFSPSGQILAYASRDTIHLYDVASNEAIGESLTGHTDNINCLTFLSNGHTLASGSKDTTVRMWELAVTKAFDRQPLEQVEPNRPVTHLVLSFDSQHIASAYSGGAICLWDAEAGKVNWRLYGDNHFIGHLAFSPDDHTLASCYYNGDTIFWNVASSQVVGSIADRPSGVIDLVFSPDSRFVATWEYSGDVVSVWEVPSGEMIAKRRVTSNLFQPCSMSFYFHQSNNYLIINKKYIWDISGDLLYNSDDKNAPFELVDLHQVPVTIEKRWVSLSKRFTFALPPHVQCNKCDYKKGKFVCGGDNGVDLIVDCSHLI